MSSLFASQKPYTAVTVYVERLTGSEYAENDLSGIVDLIEAIRIQNTGPTEAARAIRKKLKYGNSHQQLRALTILDGLIQNAGSRFQRGFADEPLLERLRMLPREYMISEEVQTKCNNLFRQWHVQYSGQPGMAGIASLYKDIPKRARLQQSQSKVLQETERDLDADNPFADDDDDEPSPSQRRKSSLSHQLGRDTSSPSASRPQPTPVIDPSSNRSKKDKKKKRKVFSLERERPQIMQSIASANVASTNLLNALKFVNRETTRVSESPEVMNRFETCKSLRRDILRYIQLVEGDQLIGNLLQANDDLVQALMTFEVMDKSLEHDSDSEAEAAPANSVQRHGRQSSRVDQDLAGLSLNENPPSKPPRPSVGAAPPPPPIAPPLSTQHHHDSGSELGEVDENDPFGDQHAI